MHFSLRIFFGELFKPVMLRPKIPSINVLFKQSHKKTIHLLKLNVTP